MGATDTAMKQTLGFQAEVKQLLQLMIHSLYSNKQIFLRELISNASDALDKLRFEAIAQPGCSKDMANWRSASAFDKAARTITVSDNGIGMSRQEAIDHLGTIAKSGHARILRAADRRPAEGCAADRPVRRRVSIPASSWPTASPCVTRRAGTPAEEAVRCGRATAAASSRSSPPNARYQRHRRDAAPA